MERCNSKSDDPGQPGTSNLLNMIRATNPYIGTGLEQIYGNFLVERDHCTNVFGTEFGGSPCLPGCPVLIKQSSNFKRHAQAKHPTELLQINVSK